MCSCTIPSVLIFSALFDQGLLMVFPNGEISVYSTYIYILLLGTHCLDLVSFALQGATTVASPRQKVYIVKAILFVGHNRQ